MALIEWQPIDLSDDPDEARYEGDPADLIDAMADLYALLERPAWHAHAACRGQGTTAWFPGQGDDVRPAKAICVDCPVAAECLTVAMSLSSNLDAGIWGGLSERQRRELRRTSTIVDTAA